MSRELVIAYDLEALGGNYRYHPMTQLALAAVDVATDEVVATFSSYIGNDENREVEPRCLNEFWLATDEDTGEYIRKDLLERNLEGMKKAPPTTEVMSKFVDVVNEAATGYPEVTFATDTSSFEAGFITNYLPRPMSDKDPVSVDFLLKRKPMTDGTLGPMYNPIRDVTEWFKGIGWANYAGNSFEAACKSLNVEVPKFNVSHDHNAANDALLLALQYAYIKRVVNQWRKAQHGPGTVFSTTS